MNMIKKYKITEIMSLDKENSDMEVYSLFDLLIKFAQNQRILDENFVLVRNQKKEIKL